MLKISRFLFLAIVSLIFGNLMFVLFMLNLGNLHLVKNYLGDTQFEKPIHLGTNSIADYKVQRLLGITDFIEGRYTEAIKNLESANALNPVDAVATFWLAKTYDASGKYIQSLQLMHLLGLNDFLPGTYSQLSPQNTISLARELAISNAPVSANVKHYLAEQVYSSDKDIAVTLFNQAYTLAPNDTIYSLDVAWFFYTNGESAEASRFAKLASQQFPENPWVDFFWETYYRSTDNIDLALNHFQQILLKDPSKDLTVKAYQEITRAYMRQGQYQIALKYLDLVNLIDENQLATYLLYAQVYLYLGDCEQVSKVLVKAANLVTTEQQPYYESINSLARKQCLLN